MKPQVYIFVGRSGAGKGTQVELLIKHLKSIDPSHSVLRVESGALLREFSKGETYSQKLLNKAIVSGSLAPEAIITALWSDFLIKNFTNKESLIFDGCPRKIQEAYLLTGLLQFYKIEKPNVVFFDVSRKWSENRLIDRGRKDDTKEAIARRLDWYEDEVKPVVDYFQTNKYFNFITINGEQAVDKVHSEIIQKISL